MGALLALTAGGHLPEVTDGPTARRPRVHWTPDLVADHVGVTNPARTRRATPSPTPRPQAVPDALVGLAWPAVFACIGAVEGLLDLVHLDHRITRGHDCPTEGLTELQISRHPRRCRGHHRRSGDQRRGPHLDPTDGEDVLVARLHERFMVRGRTARPTWPPRPRWPSTPRRSHPRPSRPVHRDRAAPHGRLRRGQRRPQPAAHRRRRCAPRGLRRARSCTACGSRPSPSARPPRCGATHHPRADPQLAGPLGRPAAARRRGGDHRRAHRRRRRRHRRRGRAAVAETASWRWSPRRSSQPRARRTPSPARASRARAWASRPARAPPRPARSGTAPTQHTREALGFSILAVVRDNPTDLWADGELHRHPDGVLFLTQFTQVAMATLAVAQVAEMREAGVFVEDAITCGHSVGEYNALAAVTGILPLEALLEIVFRRGMAMHHLVPRDAARPEQLPARGDPALADRAWPTTTSPTSSPPSPSESGEFIQIVNYNLRGSQYAIAGTVAGLKALEDEVEERRERRRRQARLHPRARHRRAVPLLRAARRRRRLPRASRRRCCRRRSTRRSSSGATSPTWCRACSPSTGTTSRRWRSTSTRRSSSRPSRTGTTWEADPARLGRDPADRAARLAVRQPGALDRDPGPAVRLARARRPRHRAVRRGRRGQRADPGQPGRADDQARRRTTGSRRRS